MVGGWDACVCVCESARVCGRSGVVRVRVRERVCVFAPSTDLRAYDTPAPCAFAAPDD